MWKRFGRKVRRSRRRFRGSRKYYVSRGGIRL